MDKTRVQTYFLVILLTLVFVALCILFSPYLSVFILALALGVIFQPLHRHILKYLKNPALSSFISTLIILVIILGPVAWIITQVVQEAFDLTTRLQSNNYDFSGIVDYLQNSFNSYFPHVNLDIKSYLAGALTWLAQHAGGIFSDAVKTVFTLFLSVIALYYWFKDSEKMKAWAVDFSPLSDGDDFRILAKLKVSVHSIIRGTLLVAVIQGILSSIGFWIFGIPSAILWGTVAAISALIPGVGTSLILGPAILYLFLVGQFLPAIGLLIWSALAVGLIDNFLGPKLISRKSELHPFFILISVLGGLHLMGPIGFLAGPLILALFYALLDIYRPKTT